MELNKAIEYPDSKLLAGLAPELLWLAQDQDGSWWAYRAEPHLHDTGWYENEIAHPVRVTKTKASPQWQHSLTKVQTLLALR